MFYVVDILSLVMEEHWSCANFTRICQGKRKWFAWNLKCRYCVLTWWGRFAMTFVKRKRCAVLHTLLNNNNYYYYKIIHVLRHYFVCNLSEYCDNGNHNNANRFRTSGCLSFPDASWEKVNNFIIVLIGLTRKQWDFMLISTQWKSSCNQ